MWSQLGGGWGGGGRVGAHFIVADHMVKCMYEVRCLLQMILLKHLSLNIEHIAKCSISSLRLVLIMSLDTKL